ncbi:glycerophosphoryl diester phosphodiesterase [Desulfuromonas versatilis]|uniref:Glycerophosphoryl diester phosphodiesterase n=1 Tax=Desulfuromonas versatilis TaxID=2802975 RepID=A0ABM8HW57_9BACT|nr:glycerophosphodiester phosphodiesterase [Desulfuromonas versatilis]BCR05356.1 glycerophosphoryl diester phosphodiesterase [Desulfuromonas versatilis]
MTSVYLKPPPPRLFGHRGASAHFPENTLPAFRAAVEAGMPYLEMDVWATADGAVVVHHDETLQRLCGVDRRVSEITLAELRRMDAGWGFTPDGGGHPFRGKGITVPTLDEVLKEFPTAFCNIEIKQSAPSIEQLVLDTVRGAGMEARVLLAAEQDAIMTRLRPLCGTIPTSLSYGETAAFFAWLGGGCKGDYQPPGVALQIPETWGGRLLVSAESVQAAHAVGLEVHVWTVNDPQSVERLLKLGVDGLMSDYPEMLAGVAGKHKD